MKMKRQQQLMQVIKNHNLFLKMFVVMVISIVAVSLFITFSSIRMSSHLFMDTFSITNTKVLGQIESRFESLSYAIVNAKNDVQDNGTIKRGLTEQGENAIAIAESKYQIMKQLERIDTNIEPYNASMIVFGKQEQLYNMNYSNWSVSWEELAEHPITHSAVNHPDILQYHYVPSLMAHSEPMIIGTKALTERSTDHVYGILYFLINEDQLKAFYEGYTSEGNNVLLINEKGTIVSSSQGQWAGKDARDVLQASKEVDKEQLEYKDVHVLQDDYMLMSEYLPTYDMYLVNLVDQNAVLQRLINPKEIIFISMGIVIIAVIIVFVISRRMTKSISQLVHQISDIANHHFNKPITETGGYEANQIAYAFNSMLHELQEYVDVVVQTQQRQRDAELRALQHQINPHFLYNTLTSVKLMVQQGKKEQATDTIHALSSLLQHALGRINQTITVEEEIENMKNYVLINQARYGDRIKVNYFISPDCLHHRLPKLVLQPFIENAFFHAFNEKKEGFIQLLIAQREDRLVCEIVDNGDGIDMAGHNMKAKRQLFTGIGVRNVHERIQLLYGHPYGVEMTSAKGEGTRVRIELPLREE
ncbi:two-component sensor histidine kinase [Gracilibacillus halophilus YIM-C55.5]|uniref:Two-component sensor histidine kinase n=1 Tax=Gracilibacillus halophilus YIM-C55.5 TaxID=1308866 RepID=N4WNB8_9BACI|nr:sensor histidine kinase [Gracilibacillus halophilus]ENH95985.1 two-component sensor histidine kinase [Gracilibacillus halophilus YIM-C55.5]